ncbi:hypothetical protein XI05_19010 [Bradyrhizobium sp. CCBAU 11357]|nr:hypothetical protein [Bradyrhizobium sp. CCBAU 11357]
MTKAAWVAQGAADAPAIQGIGASSPRFTDVFAPKLYAVDGVQARLRVMAGLVPAIQVWPRPTKNVDARAFASPERLRPRRRDKPGHDDLS